MQISSAQNPYATQLAPAYGQIGQKPLGLESSEGRLQRSKPVETPSASAATSAGRRRLPGEGAEARDPSEQDDPRREQSLQARLEAKQLELERAEIRDLAARDREVRAHEQAHMSAAGPHAMGVTYEYQKGPDGVNYAVGGEVAIDTAPEATPEATLQKAQRIARAAMAPAEPSPQDRKVAAEAAQMAAQARDDLMQTHRDQAAARLEQQLEQAPTPEAADTGASADAPDTQLQRGPSAADSTQEEPGVLRAMKSYQDAALGPRSLGFAVSA